MPVWWRWYYWGCPVAWTLYGLIASQWGDINSPLESGELVKDYIRSYYGYKHDFLGPVAGVVIGLTIVFAFIFALCIRSFNFQRRQILFSNIYIYFFFVVISVCITLYYFVFYYYNIQQNSSFILESDCLAADTTLFF